MSLSPAFLPLTMKEFCAKTSSLLILAHSDSPPVWAPDKPPLWPAGWMSPGNPLISEGHFLSQATATRAVSTGAGKVGQTRTGGKPGGVFAGVCDPQRDRYLLSAESDLGIISICLQFLKVMHCGPNHVIHRNLHR